MPALPITDALILCGGRATRLGGIDKPLARLAGRPLIERVLPVVPAGARVLISANAGAAHYAAYGEVLADDPRWAGQNADAHARSGPLAGIEAGLRAARGAWLLVLPGDAPALPVELAAGLATQLASALETGRARIAFAHDGAGPQPLCALIDTALAADLSGHLAGGGRAPRDWYARHAAVAVRFDHAPRWGWSLNTPEEWRAAEAALGGPTLRR